MHAPLSDAVGGSSPPGMLWMAHVLSPQRPPRRSRTAGPRLRVLCVLWCRWVAVCRCLLLAQITAQHSTSDAQSFLA